MVTARGGTGIWAQVDHTQPEQVKALFERIGREQDGRLDVVVNDISGDWHFEWENLSGVRHLPFWEQSLDEGLKAQINGVHSHLITSYYAIPLLVARRQGLIVEVTDGNHLAYNNCGVFYSLSKTAPILLAHFYSEELRKHNVAAVALTPGWLRSEVMLESKGVTEENWPEAYPDFASSESPFYIGRAVVALAADPNVMAKTGRALSAGWLAREYGFVDIDGRQPVWYRGEGTFSKGRFSVENDE